MQSTPSPITVRTIIIDSVGRMLIIRRSPSDPFKPGKWDIPGGQVEVGESIEAAVARETKEEVGLTLTEAVLVFATSDMRGAESKTWLFFIAPLPADGVVELGDEHDEFKWISPSDLPQYTDYEILLRLHTYVTDNNLLA